MRRLPVWVLIAVVFCGLCAVDALAQVQRAPRITIEQQPDGSQLVTVRRLERPGTINPVLEIDGVPIEFLEPGDTVLFDGSCRGCAVNFAQSVRETPILNNATLYPPQVNLILRECNLKNCTLPAHAIREGGLHGQYTNYVIEDVDVETDSGHKVKQKRDDIHDIHGPPTVKNHHIDRRNAKILNKTITPELKALILAEAQAMADAYVLLDPEQQAEWEADDGVWNLFIALGQILIDTGVLQ